MARIKEITPKQIITADKLFDQYITHEGCAEGVCRYVNGHDDAWVAKQVGVTDEQVARLRVKLHGKLQLHRPPRADPHARLLELSALLSKTALACAELAGKLGESDIAVILRGLAQDATLAE